MKERIFNILKCPYCEEKLSFIKTKFSYPNCERSFFIKDGVLSFLNIVIVFMKENLQKAMI